jgi:hypothetical protein
VFLRCQRSVVKDRERHCLLIALIVRRRGVIFCNDSSQFSVLSRQPSAVRESSPRSPTARDLGHPAKKTLRHLMHGLKSVPCNDSNAIALPFAAKGVGTPRRRSTIEGWESLP